MRESFTIALVPSKMSFYILISLNLLCFYFLSLLNAQVYSPMVLKSDFASLDSLGNKFFTSQLNGYRLTANNIDLNKDGTQDLVLTSQTNMRIFPFLFNQGKFEYAPEYESIFPDGAIYPEVLDLNNTGNFKLYAGANLGDNIFTNISNNSQNWDFNSSPSNWLYRTRFQYNPNLPLNNQPLFLPFQKNSLMCIADVNADKDLDLIEYESFYRTFLYYENVVFNQDTLQIMNKNWGEFSFDLEGYPKFGFAPNGFEKYNIRPRATRKLDFQIFDFDGDGDQDMLYRNPENSELILVKNGKTEFQLQHDSMFLYDPNAFAKPIQFVSDYTISYADINGDNLKDIVLIDDSRKAELDIKPMVAYLQSQKNNITTYDLIQQIPLEFTNIRIAKKLFPAFIDLDKDGDEDLIAMYISTTQSMQKELAIANFINIGTQSNPEFQLFSKYEPLVQIANYLDPVDMKLKDVDNDGDLDMVVLDRQANLILLENQNNSFSIPQNGLITKPYVLEESIFPNSFDLLDINQDNELDLFLFLNNSINIFENKGTGFDFNFVAKDDSQIDIIKSLKQTHPKLFINNFANSLIFSNSNIKQAQLIIFLENGSCINLEFDKTKLNKPAVIKEDMVLLDKKNNPSRPAYFSNFVNVAFAKPDLANGTYGVICNSHGNMQFAFSQPNKNSNPKKELISFVILPNPTKNTVQISLGAIPISTLLLTDITGKMIARFSNVQNSTFSFDFGTLTNGVYYVTLTNSQGSSTQKIIKID